MNIPLQILTVSCDILCLRNTYDKLLNLVTSLICESTGKVNCTSRVTDTSSVELWNCY